LLGVATDVSPRTYRLSAGARRAMSGIAVLLGGMAIFSAIGRLIGFIRLSPSLFDLLSTETLLAVLAAWTLIKANTSVVLEDHAIRLVSALGSYRLARHEIAGYRKERGTGQITGPFFTVIVPKDRTKRSIRLPLFLHVDRAFHDWMQELPRLPRT
jgi:hypothetical protein